MAMKLLSSFLMTVAVFVLFLVVVKLAIQFPNTFGQVALLVVLIAVVLGVWSAVYDAMFGDK